MKNIIMQIQVFEHMDSHIKLLIFKKTRFMHEQTKYNIIYKIS